MKQETKAILRGKIHLLEAEIRDLKKELKEMAVWKKRAKKAACELTGGIYEEEP